ncbi:hypothetical protein E4T56_gene13757 [Termitomyces sp. T112]|nr:hypothetical protein E4T56_gene13757 [Termitomyces sp. T112]
MVYRTLSRMQIAARIPLTTSRNVWFKFPSDVYQPGHRLSLGLRGGKAAEVEIIKAFTPFTCSAVLLVHARTSMHSVGVPDRFILKLADRRVSDVWNFQEEEDYQSNISKRGASFELQEEEDLLPWMKSFRSWQSYHALHVKEREAYSYLKEAQASGLIPRFFGTTKINMMTTAPHQSLSHINGLLLEYIPGRLMAKIRPGITITFEEAEAISQRVLELGRQLRRFGVCHSDVHVGNIILREKDNSPVLIDWGLATLPAPGASLNERWNDIGVETDFNRDLRYLLRDGVYYEGPNDDEIHPPITAGGIWHRFRTPLSDEEQIQYAQEWGYHSTNLKIAGLPEEEKALFYDEDMSVDIDHGLRWKVKKGVKTRELDDPCPAE